MTGEFPFLEFPFDPALLANTERRRIEATQLRALDTRDEIAAAPRPVPRRSVLRRLAAGAAWTLLGAFLTVAAVTGVRLFPPASPHFVNRAPAAASSIPPSQPFILPEQPSIGFEATRQDGDLRLTWKRDSAVIRGATSGVLSIRDGSSRREIRLLAEQVRAGSILYSPVSDQVQMQLTVSSPTASATEAVIVINPRVGPPKVRAVSSNTVTVETAQPRPSSDGASRTAPLRAFNPSFAAPPAPGPRVVLDAPPTLAANPNAAVAGPAAFLNRELPAVPPPPVQPAVQTPVEKAAPAASLYDPPVAIHSVLPEIPSSLQVLTWTPKTLEIAVSIDDHGRVVKTSALPGSGLHKLLIEAALDAARLWKFRPARRGDQPVPSEMVLRFDFKPKM